MVNYMKSIIRSVYIPSAAIYFQDFKKNKIKINSLINGQLIYVTFGVWKISFLPYRGGATCVMHAFYNPKIKNIFSLKPLIETTIRLHGWVYLDK